MKSKGLGRWSDAYKKYERLAISVYDYAPKAVSAEEKQSKVMQYAQYAVTEKREPLLAKSTWKMRPPPCNDLYTMSGQ